MCKLNISCQVWDGSCNCDSLQPVFKPIPVPFISQSDPSVLLTLLKIINEQNDLIQGLAQQTKQGLERISALEKEIDSRDNLVQTEESLSPGKMVEILYGKNHSFDYSLNPVADCPNPAYKERAFSLMLQVVDSKNLPVVCEKKLLFKLDLYNTENPPKLMTVTTTGEPMIRGCLEVESDGSILFSKVVIKEVSSHFKGGCFYLVISCKDSDQIKPYIIENLVVKARKMANECKKKAKLEEAEQ